MKLKFILPLLLVLIAAPSFSQVKVQSKAYEEMLRDLLSHTVDEVTVAEISDKDSTIVFLDAREWSEFKVSHIKNAIWVGYDDFDFSRLDSSIKKSDKIVVYCSVGYRSEKIAEKLEKKGYKNVHNLYGSIFEWVNQGKLVYNMKGQTTQKVHGFNPEWGRWLRKGVRVY